MRQALIHIGRVVNAHGVRGEIRVLPADGDPFFLTGFETVYLNGKPVRPVSSRVHKGFTLLRLPGVEDMNAALALKGAEIAIARADAGLPPEGYFDEELLGMRVHDGESGALLGEITAVERYPASKIYTVQGEKTYLIPAVPEAFILSVDLENNRMDVRVWEGLATDAD